ncbi:MAG: DNA-directed RNA polymerase subunit omega [Flavobacteriales bacterium]|nr:DNA-directed RNA polymerase subunit omega [Flavobacteriales bacterium]NNK80071.1 DNA-directed RNA polymerase subunit omega [Flavobacteriales bacterium]
MSFKNSTAERTTITRDAHDFEAETGNIYESIVIMAKRADQISVGLKEELMSKLAEFATTQDSLEEVFENREQIEISRFYERLPKPPAISLQEMEQEKIYHRMPEEDSLPPASED